MRWGLSGWTGRLVVGGFAAGAILAFWDVSLLLHHSQTAIADSDFRDYYVAAKIGLAHGWASLYNAGLELAGNVALYPPFRSRSIGGEVFASPPITAWLALPATPFPLGPATVAAILVGIAALVTATWLAAGGPSPARLVAVLLVLGFFPTEHGLQLGSAAILVAAGVGFAAYLLRRDRQVAAGLCLLANSLKPNVALLVPFALAAAGYRRSALTWIAGVVVLAVTGALALGAQGLRAAWTVLTASGTNAFNILLTPRGVLGNHTWVLVLQALVAVGTLVAARFVRRLGSDQVVAVGAVGSTLVVPYLHTQDLLALAMAAVIVWRSASAVLRLSLALTWISAEFVWVLGPGPLVGLELLSLAVLAAGPLVHAWSAEHSGVAAWLRAAPA